MGIAISLNLLLLMAMVATNIFSLYHLSSSLLNSPQSSSSLASHPIPDHLLHQLGTIRATINHFTRLRPTTNPKSTPSNAPSDLLLYTRIAPIASACRDNADLLHRYMNYTPYSLCPSDAQMSEALIIRGCHPLPRRRCFTRTVSKPPISLPLAPFPSSLPDSAIDWTPYTCKSFACLNRINENLGFNTGVEASKFKYYRSDLDLPIPQLMQLAASHSSVLRLGLDIGGGTATFAARMKLHNVTIVTTTMNLGAPYNEAAALRGLIPLHVPLQQRLPVFDGSMDLVRCGRAVNRWIPFPVMEFLLYDVDRVLRGGGFLWVDGFLSRRADLDRVYGPLIGKLGYKRLKWATANRSAWNGLKNDEIFLTALLYKPLPK